MDGPSQKSQYRRVCQRFQRSRPSIWKLLACNYISEGSIRFTIQAENISALDVLWQSYQDEKLKTNLQEFLVTEEIKQLAGGEVTLTVHIDEDEYRNARFDLMISGTEGKYTFNSPAIMHDSLCEIN